jgi:hypothetical protein
MVQTIVDRYLNNWVYTYPILKKYNLKGTIFINLEFIDDSKEIQNNLNDVCDKKIEHNQLVILGFLNWAELQKNGSF